MTDSIKTSLSLTRLSPLVRKDIPANLCTVSTPWGELVERYTKPSYQKSGMTDTKTKWVVRCGPDLANPSLGEVPQQIDADLNIPNAAKGHNLEHGTSVIAAGVTALELQRIWLATRGLPRHELDLLTTADVSVRGTTITYSFPRATKEEAVALVEAIKVTARVLNPRCTVESSTNDTVIIPKRDHTIKVYIKTNLEHCKFAAGAPVAGLVDRAAYIVRVEVKLGVRFLRKMNLLILDSWRDAYEKGVYEQIFNETVRKSLRLDERLRHKEPREEVYARLTPTEARLLRGYIAGRDPRKFQSVVASRSPGKRLSDLRRRLLALAQTDIDIKWAEHVNLRCRELADTLHYPPDYHPSEEHTPWCFCQADWSNLQQDLRQTYETALAAAASQQLTTTGASNHG